MSMLATIIDSVLKQANNQIELDKWCMNGYMYRQTPDLGFVLTRRFILFSSDRGVDKEQAMEDSWYLVEAHETGTFELACANAQGRVAVIEKLIERLAARPYTPKPPIPHVETLTVEQLIAECIAAKAGNKELALYYDGSDEGEFPWTADIGNPSKYVNIGEVTGEYRGFGKSAKEALIALLDRLIKNHPNELDEKEHVCILDEETA